MSQPNNTWTLCRSNKIKIVNRKKETLLCVYDFHHCIMNKGFALFTPANKRFRVIDVVNNSGKFNLLQTQPRLKGVGVNSSQLSCRSINTTWEREVWNKHVYPRLTHSATHTHRTTNVWAIINWWYKHKRNMKETDFSVIRNNGYIFKKKTAK